LFNTFTGLSWFISSTILKVITLEPFSTFLLITISKWIHARMFENTEEMFHLVLQHRMFINAMNPEDPEITVLQNAIVEMICEHCVYLKITNISNTNTTLLQQFRNVI
jgi:hypothetical protein